MARPKKSSLNQLIHTQLFSPKRTTRDAGSAKINVLQPARIHSVTTLISNKLDSKLSLLKAQKFFGTIYQTKKPSICQGPFKVDGRLYSSQAHALVEKIRKINQKIVEKLCLLNIFNLFKKTSNYYFHVTSFQLSCKPAWASKTNTVKVG